MDEYQIFEAALGRSAGKDRDEFIESRCSDEAQQQRIRALLAAHENPESYLERPIGDHEIDETIAHEIERDGRQIGPYKLLQQIGEGGMGVVFMAEQTEPVKRRVALKIIKPGMDTRDVIARFEAERQALALMDHPNIAKVLDAGQTQRGRPYFVMEFVNGLPITEYCNENHLSTAERLALFADVCRGVQHAHQKGVIHRDLKPSNILVAEYDHHAVPKVIDFGVAKATNQQLTDKTLFTHFGQIVGTLEYMSPEQAKRNQLDVDTRSDVYSLGIVLYELLTGAPPFDKQQLRDAAVDEMLRIIREEEPQLPSLKLSRSAEIAAIAAQRGVEPNRLASLVRGDLDWIVLKTLEKDRSKRYGTPIELADDVQRHLDDRPIQAGPPRMATKLIKFARRNAVALLSIVAISAILIGMGGWAVQASADAAKQRAERSQRASHAIEAASLALGKALNSPVNREAEWVAADAALMRLRDLLAEGNVDADVRSRAEALLVRGAQDRTQRDIAVRLENVLITSASHPDLESWQRMERELRQIFADNGFDLVKEEPMEIAKRIREHQFSELFTDVLELWIATRGYMSGIGGPPATRENMQPWADAIYAADDDPLRTGIRRIIYTMPIKPPTKEEVQALTRGVDLTALSPRTSSWLSVVHRLAQMPEEADRIYQDAMRRHPTDVMLIVDHGLGLAAQSRHQEALRVYSQAIAMRPDAAGIWQLMGISLQAVAEAADTAEKSKALELENARDAFQRACDLEKDYGPTWINLGDVLLKLERFEEAADAGGNAVSLLPDHPGGHGVVGRALMHQDKLDEALMTLEHCEQLAKKTPRWTGPIDEWLKTCRELLQKSKNAATQLKP